MPRTLYARNGNIHLAYQVIGEGPRDVVLSMDWGSHLEVLWEQPFMRDLLASLARFSRVLWFACVSLGFRIACSTRRWRPRTGWRMWPP